jgi:hypothetical protein
MNKNEQLYSFGEFGDDILNDEDRLDKNDDNLFESLIVNDDNLNNFLNDNVSDNNDGDEIVEENKTEIFVESDDHLPLVQEELDKLNYSNESINNLELELEESKREYTELSKYSEETLLKLEKKIGSCVGKTRIYFDGLIELKEAKQIYIKAKNHFEAAQALYVAAKEMQTYAEDNLELNLNKELNRQTLIDILENAKEKALEAEKAKQIRDKTQIDALKVYEDKQKFIKEFEEKQKRTIAKSREYYELRAKFNKELKFQHDKIEGLKNCLKEAKSVYQQSLNNLEKISSDIHTQRKSFLNAKYDQQKSLDDLSSVNTEYVSFNFDHKLNINNSLSLQSTTQHTTDEIKSNYDSLELNGLKLASQNSLNIDDNQTSQSSKEKRPQFRAPNLISNNFSL